MMAPLLPYTSRELILERLPLIFPLGTPNRQYCIRELAASTVFTMLYINAVDGTDIYAGPAHVYRMTEEQASQFDADSRETYRMGAVRGKQPAGVRWYADNTREPIRDETIREGLIPVGAILSLQGIPTTSGKPRYYLNRAFALLFDPALTGEQLSAAIKAWQITHLSKSALMRLSLAGLGAGPATDVLVTFPNQETRSLTAGPSSIISKAVIEVFAQHYLEQPGVLWLSTSDRKVLVQDEKLAALIGLNIDVAKNLPDIILVDLAPVDPLVIFVEVVATDGAITERRQQAIYALTDAAGFDRKQILFVTAYQDRQSAGFSKTIKDLAWNSFVWFVSEPDKLLIWKDGVGYLSELL
jgi:hypothetical protein